MTEAQVHPYAGRRVLLGVAGGIASYKTAWLARLLTKAGAYKSLVDLEFSRLKSIGVAA